jgi:lipoic acid synthetase
MDTTSPIRPAIETRGIKRINVSGTGLSGTRSRKPAWIKIRLAGGREYERIKELKRSKSLNTVCEAAGCPNLPECWGMGHATFMILGSTCTRNCRFCGVPFGSPDQIDPKEPGRVAEAALKMGLRHTVVTSVTRDDLADGGAGMFAAVIRELKGRIPEGSIEVLVPDFRGSRDALELVVGAAPDILGHNVETVPRLYNMVRPGARYGRSLAILSMAKKAGSRLLTKSGFMVGLGETQEELFRLMKDLRSEGCDILTIGQYLRPTGEHLPVVRYYTPEEFISLRKAGLDMGFLWVESGPLVRSSYGAEAQAGALLSSCHKRSLTQYEF